MQSPVYGKPKKLTIPPSEYHSMSRILLAEDSRVQAKLISSILSAGGYQVETTPDGKQAIERIGTWHPDLVLTDLLMPIMNGLQVVDAVRRDYPFLPVVLITGHGSEEMAVKALSMGAASYVPKPLVMERHDMLISTIDDVLASATVERHYDLLRSCVVQTEKQYRLPADPDLFAPLCEHIQQRLRELEFGPEIDLIRIGVALREALTNALYHGNLEVDSELRQDDDKRYYEKIKERQKQKPYCQRYIYVETKESRTSVELTIRDEGPGFNPALIPDPTELLHLNRPYGRGLLLIRSIMHEVRHNETGNEIIMVKLRT
jgi:CheY-like chemotaxis protein